MESARYRYGVAWDRFGFGLDSVCSQFGLDLWIGGGFGVGLGFVSESVCDRFGISSVWVWDRLASVYAEFVLHRLFSFGVVCFCLIPFLGCCLFFCFSSRIHFLIFSWINLFIFKYVCLRSYFFKRSRVVMILYLFIFVDAGRMHHR